MTEENIGLAPRRGRPPIDRGDLRDEPRPELRAEDSRARAERRHAELLDHLNGLDEAPDQFQIDRDQVPDGWEYEWKTLEVFGKENPAYQVNLARTGWEAVDVSRHANLMPKDYKGSTIIRDGMQLMERPKSISDEVRRRELSKARAQMGEKERQLKADAPDGQFARKGNVKKEWQAIEIPE